MGDNNSDNSNVGTLGNDKIRKMGDHNRLPNRILNNRIYNNPACDDKFSNHDVLIVGEGMNNKNQDYWIHGKYREFTVGQRSGEKMVMLRNRQNQCGIAAAASYPLYNINRYYKVPE
ncbi:unnamed protein product [Dracunculus medinensis]|uniref:Pept_C1 domain-containing protein n=1 Tax=Dracunculus medinensis TaxID=318479 RepID=A0A0N4UM07_DRAME|nr:unnamed protein product [Dracunculus medinensis]